MSLKSRFFTVLTVAGATVLFSTIGFAQDTTTPTPNATDKVAKHGMGRGQFGPGQMGRRGGPGMMRRGGGIGMMLHGLNLTDDQKTQIQSILAANKPAQGNREEIRTLMMARQAGLLTTAQQARLTAIRTAGQEKARGIHEQILGVLTAEQKATIEQRKQQMLTRMQERKALRQQTTPPTKP